MATRTDTTSERTACQAMACDANLMLSGNPTSPACFKSQPRPSFWAARVRRRIYDDDLVIGGASKSSVLWSRAYILVLRDEASSVPRNHHSELFDFAAEPGLDHRSHPQITRDWCERRRGDFQIYISQFVLDEAGAGDSSAARERLKALQSLFLLDITPEVAVLTSGILASGRIPRKAATDAAHIAIAAVHGMDFRVTWNCVHIANAVIVKVLASICRGHGCECPVICTPEELLGE